MYVRAIGIPMIRMEPCAKLYIKFTTQMHYSREGSCVLSSSSVTDAGP